MKVSNSNVNFAGGYRVIGIAPESIKTAIEKSIPIKNFLESSPKDLLIRVKSRIVPKRFRFKEGLDAGERMYNLSFSLSYNKDSVFSNFLDFFAKHVNLSKRSYEDDVVIARLNSRTHMKQRVFSELV